MTTTPAALGTSEDLPASWRARRPDHRLGQWLTIAEAIRESRAAATTPKPFTVEERD